jgi:ornithine decarboxylase antizyme 1
MPINCQPRGTTYTWVQGLGSAPDVPHAVNASARKTEGSGVGVTKEPPVSVRALETVSGGGRVHGIGGTSGVAALCGPSDTVLNLCFCIRLVGQEVTWETLLIGKTLFIEIPSDILPEGSKESFVTLLEYAEEVLSCSHVIVCFKKTRGDRASLVRTFMFLGFVPVAPGTHRLAVSGDLMYLAYTVQSVDDDDSSASDADDSD